MRWLPVLLLSVSLARASCDVPSKTCTNNGSDTAMNADLVTIRAAASTGWVIKMTASATWTTQVNAAMSGNYTLEITSNDVNSPVTIGSTYTAGVTLLVNSGTALTTIHDIRFVDYSGNPCFMLVQGHNECFHFYNLYLHGTNDINTFFCFIGGNYTNGGGDGPFGLIDHITMDQSNSARLSGFFVHQNLDSSDYAWDNTKTVTWETRNNVFFEDCTVLDTTYGHGAGLLDGDQSAKLVFRYNTLYNAGVGYHGRDTNSDASHWRHGTLQFEGYQNVFYVQTGAGIPFLIQGRSGTALIHDNGVIISGTGTVTQGFSGREECATEQWADFGCRDWTTGSLTSGAFVFPGDYQNAHDYQSVGTPEVARVWSNSITGGLFGGGVNAWATGFPGDFLSAGPSGRDILYSTDATVMKPGYAGGFTYPHPLNNQHTNTAPTVVIAPVITGTARIGQTLTSTQGQFNGFPKPTLTYQWKICDAALSSCSNISGATSLSYVLLGPDAESRIKQCTTATNNYSSSDHSVESCSTPTGSISGSSPFNLFDNPGFETFTGHQDFPAYNDGAWSSWIAVNASGYLFPTTESHTGSYAVKFTRGWTDSSNQMSVSQSVVTTNGVVYPLTFYSKNDATGPHYSVKDAVNDTYIINRTQVSHGSYTQTSTSFTATSALTTFIFDAIALGGAESAWLDDVEIVPPSSGGGTGGSGAPSALRSGKKSILLKKK